MSTQNAWKELDRIDAHLLGTPSRHRRRRKGWLRRLLRPIQRTVTRLTDSVGVPLLVTAASGGVRGEAADLWISQRITPVMDVVHVWLTEYLVHDRAAWLVSRCVPSVLIVAGILLLSAVLVGIRNYVPCIVISEIARRQGRTISLVDLVIANSLPVSMTVAIVSHGSISVIAVVWFWLAFGFCRISFNPKRVRGFLDWIVRLRGPMGALGIDAGDVDVDDQDQDS